LKIFEKTNIEHHQGLADSLKNIEKRFSNIFNRIFNDLGMRTLCDRCIPQAGQNHTKKGAPQHALARHDPEARRSQRGKQ